MMHNYTYIVARSMFILCLNKKKKKGEKERGKKAEIQDKQRDIWHPIFNNETAIYVTYTYSITINNSIIIKYR